ncbi:MAG: glycogen debranching protein GlgX [Synechococcaceae cyanobacterium]|nr:glycogen debranching protein GlgX [Synechococcaceae cyanobacterium]
MASSATPSGSEHSGAIEAGSAAPLGASLVAGGVNFSVYARDAEAVELVLYSAADPGQASHVIPLDPERHRTGAYWHALVPGIGAGQIYAWRVTGPWAPERGLRFNPANPLLDPYAAGLLIPQDYQRIPGRNGSEEGRGGLRSVVIDLETYDWEGDRPLRRPSRETVIYELHVGSFTRDPSSAVPDGLRGTYAGLIHKIPYLQDLGITAVELLPVFQFDPQAAPAGRRNIWGYQPLSFFAPHQGYSSTEGPEAALNEFRDLVKALHRAGIEVILDVVFNHTAEGAADGPSVCFRGLADRDYYLQQGNPSTYLDDTGCGNTFNANHAVVRRLIRDSLRHWVRHLHVDGFRFDLAAVLSRDETGQPTPLAPILFDIDTDPVLAGTKLIAEAWDAAGLYEVGTFVGDQWQEWNGRFRDDVRRFIKGDNGLVPAVMQRLIGSPDLYGHKLREAEASINFITCHDGFTLADLVSYNGKHNLANGEQNCDGSDDNASWNCGAEGPTDNPEVLSLRQQQMRNFLTVLMLSSGTPMLSMGDEVGRSQAGNNNAYCLDDESVWFRWGDLHRQADLLRFCKELIAYRQRRDVVVDHRSLSLAELLNRHQISWHGIIPDQPDCGDSSHSFAMCLTSIDHHFRWYGMFNAWWQPLEFQLPAADSKGHAWHRWIDTSRPSPQDIVPWQQAAAVEGSSWTVAPRSISVLINRLDGRQESSD